VTVAVPVMFEALHDTRFRRIFAGQTVSMLGDWLDFVAILSLVAYTWHDGAAGLAAVAICSALPWLVVSPLSGVLADRLPARTVLVGCDLARAAIVLCYLFAGNIVVLLALVMLKVSFSTLFNPTESSAIRRVVPKDRLLSANALTSFSTQATKIIGPGLSGLLLATVGAHGAFVADSASFLCSAAILAGLPIGRPAAKAAGDSGKQSVRSEMAAGMRFILGNRVLLTAVLGMAATVFLVFTFDTLTPLALSGLGYKSELLGEWLACFGVGAVVGTFAVGQWGGRLKPLRLMGISQALAGLCVAVIGLTVEHAHHPPVLAVLPIPIAVGFAASGLLIAYPVILQTSTPVELMGRVIAFAGILPTVLQLAAPAVGAALADAFHVGPVFTVSGLLIVLVGLVIVAQRIPAAEPAPAEASAEAPPAEAAPDGPDGEPAAEAAEDDVMAHWDEPDPGPGPGPEPGPEQGPPSRPGYPRMIPSGTAGFTGL
jgi:MFS family permease